MKQFLRLFFACLWAAGSLFAEENQPRSAAVLGEGAIAERYVEWAENALREKRYAQAESFLLRAADYADVSSDLSYLLAVVKKELSAPVHELLTAARLALATDRWTLYSRRDAVYIASEALIRLGLYNEALNALFELGEDEYAAELRLLALSRLPGAADFDTALLAALERYPYNPAFPRILFRRAAGRSVPTDRERALVDTALKRLPALLKLDGELIRYAAPFMADRDEARRLLASWFESGGTGREPRIAALPLCLDSGIIGEDEAISELFYAGQDGGLTVIDRDTLLAL
jgi:tetratricopeptide (TPR) repeat protein